MWLQASFRLGRAGGVFIQRSAPRFNTLATPILRLRSAYATPMLQKWENGALSRSILTLRSFQVKNERISELYLLVLFFLLFKPPNLPWIVLS